MKRLRSARQIPLEHRDAFYLLCYMHYNIWCFGYRMSDPIEITCEDGLIIKVKSNFGGDPNYKYYPFDLVTQFMRFAHDGGPRLLRNNRKKYNKVKKRFQELRQQAIMEKVLQ